MLFESVSATLVEFGANPRWLGGEIAATLILHTWGQTLIQHIHLHCLVGAGALHADAHWVQSRRGFLFPVQALSQVFRGKFLAALTRTFYTGALSLAGATATLAQTSPRQRLFSLLREHEWVVYAKKPFGGPQQVLDYLGRDTHRVALSNNRLVGIEDDRGSFRYKDYAHGNRRKVLTLEAGEFIRRFLLHVLPRGFMRIRHYGLLANRAKRLKLAQARSALDQPPPQRPSQPESIEAFWLRSGSVRRPSVPALPRRAHGDHCFAAFPACAWTAHAASRMSPTPTAATAGLRCLLATQRTAACTATALTLYAPSVIVVSSTLKPSRTRHEAHACVLPTTSHAHKLPARVPTRYKSQSIAL